MLELTSTNVEDIYLKCLFKEDEDTSTAKMIEGVILKTGFNPIKLEENKESIVQLLMQLPLQFFDPSVKKDGGGGWSFLNLCQTNKEEIWTGLHQVSDQLLSLGLAIDKMQILLPKPYWRMWPGGMPFVCVKN